MIKYGIKAITLLPRNLNPNPQAYHHLKLVKDAKLTITEEPVKDVFDRSLPNWINFKIEAESIYNSIDIINMCHQYATSGAVMAELQAINPDTDVFIFGFDNYLGYDFEFELNPNERTIKHILEARFPYDQAKAIINNAIQNTRQWGANDQYAPWLYTNSKINFFSNLFDQNWIKDFKLTIKTVGEKTIWNRTIVNYLDINLEITSYESRATILKNLLDLGLLSSCTITGTDGFEFKINQGVLFPQREGMIGYKDKYNKIVFSGKIPVSSMVVNNTQNKVTLT
ncbi:MAG: hypothetical protein N3A61_05150 [Ignavibacteria bacterium]|nr:hypothetical protein [Ignavibacteria bacterium]